VSTQQEVGSDKPSAPASKLVGTQLRSIVERIERLEEAKKTISDDVKDVYAEAKSVGYDVKVLREVIAMRRQDPNDRAEQETILETYLHALNMI
jgi:uncharacterized protein (UPF0335 family)